MKKLQRYISPVIFVLFLLVVFLLRSCTGLAILLEDEYSQYAGFRSGILHFFEVVQTYEGFSRWVQQFFLQFFPWHLAGSVIYSMLLVLSCILFRSLLKKFGNEEPGFIGFLAVICFSLLMISVQHELILLIEISGVIFLTNVYISFRKNPKHFYLFPFLLASGWLLFGIYSVLMPVHMVMYELSKNKSKKRILLILVVSIIFIGILLYHYAFSYHQHEALPIHIRFSTVIEILAFIVFVSMLLFFPVMVRNPEMSRHKSRTRTIVLITSSLLVVSAAFIMNSGANMKDLKTEARIRELFRLEKWEEITEIASRSDRLSHEATIFANYALHRKGTLIEDLFTIPQDYASHGLISSGDATDYGDEGGWIQEYTNKAQIVKIRTCQDILFNNQAYRFAHIMLMQNNSNPDVLKLTATTHLANGEVKAAEKYINLLGEMPFHKKWAHALRESANEDPIILENNTIENKAPHDVRISYHARDNLEWLVSVSPGNRVAFDHLAAMVLLDKDINAIPELINLAGKSGIEQLPEQVELFSYIYATAHPEFYLENYGYDHRQELYMSFHKFYSAVMHSRSLEQARSELSMYKGGVLYYYFFTNESLK